MNFRNPRNVYGSLLGDSGRKRNVSEERVRKRGERIAEREQERREKKRFLFLFIFGYSFWELISSH